MQQLELSWSIRKDFTMTDSSIDLRAHFSLHALPFTREFAIEKRFCFPEFDSGLARVKQTVEQRNSIAITGPAGAGKTVFLRALRDGLPEARYKVSYLKVTGLGRRDLCRELAVALGHHPPDSIPPWSDACRRPS
jgi:type II secretory pathway predicted ATPase ExeA